MAHDLTGSGRWPRVDMEAEHAVELVDLLERSGIAVWLDGGWGVDALVGCQTRPHDDLDLVVELRDVPALQTLLAERGYVLRGGGAPMSFELIDVDGRQVDVHPVAFDEGGDGIYRMRTGANWVYPAPGFAGRGSVLGRPVRCLTPEVQLLCHADYELDADDLHDLALLRETMTATMSAAEPLRLDPETMRELGYRTVDMLVDWLGDRAAPPLRRASPDEMRARLSGPPPKEGRPFDDILSTIAGDVLPFASRVHHPAFFAFIPGSGTWPSAMGDLVASAANVYAGSWMESAGPSQLELEVLRWFGEWLGLPESAGGLLVSGGSAANATALACARESIAGAMAPDLVAYLPDQAHSSLARAARILGFGPAQVRVLPVDDDHRLRPRALAGAMEADAAARLRPLFVSVSGGSTNTGAVDPMPELAAIAHEHGAWFHVDAAYGGFAALTERGRAQLAGIELADSVTLDPHKWLYQPYECGCLLVRDAKALDSAFEITPDYLRDAATAAGEVNFADRGLQLTRTSRALKIWMSIQYFGLEAFRAAIDRSLDLAELVRDRIQRSPTLELAAAPSLGIVCFRRQFDENEDAQNAGLIAALERSGIGLVSSTRVRGRYAIRLCPLNHTSTAADVERVLSFLETAEPESAAPLERDREISGAWLRAPDVDLEQLARVPAFSSLEPAQLARVGAMARVREAARGETIVAQWTTSREFYVILEGAVEIVIDDELVNTLGAGDFFGEFAALDWAAGYAYPRLASVIATEPLRVLVFPDGALNEIVREFPSLDAVIRTALHERLPRR